MRRGGPAVQKQAGWDDDGGWDHEVGAVFGGVLAVVAALRVGVDAVVERPGGLSAADAAETNEYVVIGSGEVGLVVDGAPEAVEGRNGEVVEAKEEAHIEREVLDDGLSAEQDEWARKVDFDELNEA